MAPLHFRGHYVNHTERSNAAQSDIEITAYQPNTLWSVETMSFELQYPVASQILYQIKNPVLYLSVLDVEPSVNSELIRAAKDKADGMVRIQTFSWLTFSTQVQLNTTPDCCNGLFL